MDTIKLNNRNFVILEQKEFDKIQLMAAQKVPPVKKLSISAGRKHAHKLVEKWAKGK